MLRVESHVKIVTMMRKLWIWRARFIGTPIFEPQLCHVCFADGIEKRLLFDDGPLPLVVRANKRNLYQAKGESLLSPLVALLLPSPQSHLQSCSQTLPRKRFLLEIFRGLLP